MSNRWQNIVGHDWAVKLLSEAIERDRVGHAYLITGPEHIGKATLARTFAQALNCQSAAQIERPCGRCRSCVLIASDRHADVRLLEPEISGRGKLTLRIEAIRALQRDLNLASYEARKKVAILRSFDAATSSAANAFLKTLEEPPGHVILLLTAKDGDTLLPTITSRCRILGLRPLPSSLIEISLQKQWQVEANTAQLLAHLADGRLGWAVRASQEPALLESRQLHIEQLYEALSANRVTRFALADKMARKPERIPITLKSWLSWWRDVALLAHMGIQHRSVHLTNIDQRPYLERMSRTWGSNQLFDSFKQTDLALWQLDRNANARLVLENLFLVYPFPAT
jgi:DNA polymerase-3 subunit delta'